jgi:hypothetical protein
LKSRRFFKRLEEIDKLRGSSPGHKVGLVRSHFKDPLNPCPSRRQTLLRSLFKYPRICYEEAPTMRFLGTPPRLNIRSEDYFYFEKQAFKRDVEDEVFDSMDIHHEDTATSAEASNTADTWVRVRVESHPDFELLSEDPPEDVQMLEGDWDLESIADGEDYYWKYSDSPHERKRCEFHALNRLASLVDPGQDPAEATRQKRMFAMLGEVLRK